MKQVKNTLKNIYFSIIQWLYLIPGRKAQSLVQDKFTVPEDAIHVNAIITPVYNNKKGIVSIISDDGLLQTGKQLKELSEKLNVPITIAGTVRNIALYKKWWKKNIRKGLFECINHSYNHYIMSEEKEIAHNRKALIHEIVHSRRYFSRIFNSNTPFFVCPDNCMCNEGYAILEEDRVAAVTQGTRGINSLSPVRGRIAGQWLNLMRVGIMDKDNEGLFTRDSWIDTVADSGGWLIEMWHNVSNNVQVGYQTITPKDAEDHLKKIISKRDIWVSLFSDAVKYIYERNNSTIHSYIKNNELFLYVDVGELIEKGFDHELTVEVELPFGISFYNVIPNRMTIIDVGG